MDKSRFNPALITQEIKDSAERKLANDARNIDKFCEIVLDWVPHDGQKRWLNNAKKWTNVLVTGRRWGKSTVIAVSLLHYACTHRESSQCIVSVTLDQAKISFDEIVNFCKNSYLKNYIERLYYNPFPVLELRNRARITARASAREGIYIRGHRFQRVFIDEADYVPESVITEVIRLTLVDSGGQLILATTPKQKLGFVYKEIQRFENGDDTVYVQRGTTWDNPYLHKEYIEALRNQMTETAWLRELGGQYVDDEGAVFKWDFIRNAYETSFWKLPEEPSPSARYVAGWDLAKHVDYCVCIVLDVTNVPYRVVKFERFQRQPWPYVVNRIRAIHNEYNCHQTLIDATGVGDAILDEISDVAKGFVFTAKSKVDIISNLQFAFERGLIKFPFIRELVDELTNYAWDDKHLETDCVMALALALHAASAGAMTVSIVEHPKARNSYFNWSR
jgi:hypothetical protein